MKTKIVAKRAGTKANKDDHQGLFPTGCTNQLRSVIVGENVAGTFNFGVSTLSQTSTQVIVIMAMITAKSAKILRIFVGKKLVVRKFFNPIVMVNVPMKRSTVAKKTFGI